MDYNSNAELSKLNLSFFI